MSLRALLDKLRFWFSDLSGPKKVVAALVAIATGIGAIVGATNASIELYDKLTEGSKSASSLETVDISFVNSRSTDTKLDVKLKNIGESTAFVKTANIRVKKIWTFTRPYRCEGAALYTRPSHVYDVELPANGAPYSVRESLSQSIGPNAIDRFFIDLIPKNTDSTEDYVFLITLVLIYDAEERRLSREVLFAYPTGSALYYYSPDQFCFKHPPHLGKPHLRPGLDESDAARLLSENKEGIEEVQKIQAVENDYSRKLVQTIQ